MTLEQLFINIAPRYLNRTEAKQVKGDMRDIEKQTEKLGNAIKVAGAAFTAFATVATKSFSDVEGALAEFSGKAGMNMERFADMFEKSSSRIARQTGVSRRLILQAQQEGTSLGLSGTPLNRLVEGASKLHAGRQANILDSVTAAAAGAKYGLGNPLDVLRTIYAASQVGSGAVSDYGSVFKTVAPSANLAGLGLETTLATMAHLGGVAPSLTEGGTWFNSFLKSMAKPTGDADALLQQRTGLTFADLNARMGQEGGLQQVLNIIKDTFEDDELFDVFGRQEAVKFVSSMTAVPDAVLKLEKSVRENLAANPIQRFWNDFSKTFGSTWKQFSESISAFLTEFGKPIAAVLIPIMKGLAMLADGIVWLNDKTFGLIAVITNLIGATIALTAAMGLSSRVAGGIMGFAKGKGGLANLLGLGGLLDLFGFGGGDPEDSKRDRKGMFKSLTGLFRLATRLNVIVGAVLTALVGLVGLFRWFTRKSDAAEAGRRRARERTRMRSHFEEGGDLDETTPLPSELDSAQIQVEQATAWRKAEMSNFIGQFTERFFKWWAKNILFFPFGAISDGAPLPFVDRKKAEFMEKLNEWWEGFVTFIYDFMSDPLGWIRLWLTRKEQERQTEAANFWGGLAEFMGFDRPDRLKNQAALSDPAGDGRTPIGVIPMDKADAAGFGLTGLPPQFETPEIRQRNIVQMPQLPIPRLRRMQELGYSDDRIREAWMNQSTGGPNIQSVTVNQKIEVQGAGDPEAVARQVMQSGSSFMRQALDDALETAETPVVR